MSMGGMGDFLNSRIAVELQATTDVVPIILQQLEELKTALANVQNQNAQGLATNAQVVAASRAVAEAERALAAVIKNESTNAYKVAAEAARDYAMALKQDETAALKEATDANKLYESVLRAEIRDAERAAAEDARQRAAALKLAEEALRGLTAAEKLEEQVLAQQVAEAQQFVQVIAEGERQTQATAEAHRQTVRAIESDRRARAALADAIALMATHEETAAAATDHHAASQQRLNQTQQRGMGAADANAASMMHWTRTVYFAAQGIEDLQYGFSAVVNNLPMIGMSVAQALGKSAEAGMQWGAAISLVAVGLNTILIPAFQKMLDQDPALKAFFHSLSTSLNPFHVEEYGGAIEKLKERIKELSSQKVKLGVDLLELDLAKQKLREMEDGARAYQAAIKGYTEEDVKAGQYLQKGMAGPEGAEATQALRRNLYKQALEQSQPLQDLRKEMKDLDAEISALAAKGPSITVLEKMRKERAERERATATGKAQAIGFDLGKTAEQEAGTILKKAFEGDADQQQTLIDAVAQSNKALADSLAHDRQNALNGMKRHAELAKDLQENMTKAAEHIKAEDIKETEKVKRETDALAEGARTKAVTALDNAIKARAEMFAKAEGGTRALGAGFTSEAVARDLDAAKDAVMKPYAERIRNEAIAIANQIAEKQALEMGPGTTRQAAVAALSAKHTEQVRQQAETAQKREERRALDTERERFQAAGLLPGAQERLGRQVQAEGQRRQREFSKVQKEGMEEQFAQGFQMYGANAIEAQAMARRTVALMEQGMTLQRAALTAWNEMARRLSNLEQQMMQVQRQQMHQMHQFNSAMNRMNTQRGNVWPNFFQPF
jgi:hypothetical protein